jgi:hypothetical protein
LAADVVPGGAAEPPPAGVAIAAIGGFRLGYDTGVIGARRSARGYGA